MIKVAIIAGVLHSGGKRNLIMEYYRHIDRDKVQFDFICDSDSNGIPYDEIKSLGGVVFTVAPYKYLPWHLLDTYRILKRGKYDIIHAFDNTLNVFPMWLGKRVGIKVRISESISKGDKSEKKTFVKYALKPFSRWFATQYMANSIDCGVWQFGKRTYEKGKIAIFKSVINTGHNVFDNSLRNVTRQSYRWNDKIVYGFIGRFVEQKNPLFLIDVFNEISRIQKDALLVMVGFGELEEAMMARVSVYGLSERVINLGRRDDIKQFYNAFDAFLLPSLYEGMPIVGLEAQCSGLPIFFSKNITEETTACELAHYIELNKSPREWAKEIIPIVESNKENRRNHAEELKLAGFDSYSEARRLQAFYFKNR